MRFSHDGLVFVGSVEPSPETCDGLDNDCDSVIDNAPLPLAAAELIVTPEEISWAPLGNGQPASNARIVIRGYADRPPSA